MPNVPYPYEVNWPLVTENGSLTNMFRIKPFLITKIDCIMISNSFPLSRFFWLLELIDSKWNKITRYLIANSDNQFCTWWAYRCRYWFLLVFWIIFIIFIFLMFCTLYRMIYKNLKRSHSFCEIVEIPCFLAMMEQPKINWELEVSANLLSVVFSALNWRYVELETTIPWSFWQTPFRVLLGSWLDFSGFQLLHNWRTTR